MDEVESKLARQMGFHPIDGSNSLAQTHWLVLNPPDELDDHPPAGPEDRFFVQVYSERGADFLTDSRVRGCRHRIIRHGEWSDENRMVITRLWHYAVVLNERKASRQRKLRARRKWLYIVLFALLIAPAPILLALWHFSLLGHDDSSSAFNVYGYAAAGIIGAIYGIGAMSDGSQE
jgi:hypothetical protein